MLPFSVEDFFSVFADYNESVWPAQWLLRAAALIVLLLPASRLASRDRLVAGMLAGLWVWMAGAYHVAHFADINRAALAFAALFAIQAGLLLRWALAGRGLEFRYRADAQSIVGVAMIAYALLVYPLLNRMLGHVFPGTPTFGVPCPTTIFTLGMLMLARHRKAAGLFAIPILWSAIGGSATFLLEVWPDAGLLASGAIAIACLLPRLRRQASDARS